MMLFMQELVGVPKITLGGTNDEEIIGNLMQMIGFGFAMLALIYLLLRLYLPGALAKKNARTAQTKARHDAQEADMEGASRSP
jgi:hypothetical protein